MADIFIKCIQILITKKYLNDYRVWKADTLKLIWEKYQKVKLQIRIVQKIFNNCLYDHKIWGGEITHLTAWVPKSGNTFLHSGKRMRRQRSERWEHADCEDKSSGSSQGKQCGLTLTAGKGTVIDSLLQLPKKDTALKTRSSRLVRHMFDLCPKKLYVKL